MNGERDWDRADSAVSIVYKSGNGRVKNKKKRKRGGGQETECRERTCGQLDRGRGGVHSAYTRWVMLQRRSRRRCSEVILHHKGASISCSLNCRYTMDSATEGGYGLMCDMTSQRTKQSNSIKREQRKWCDVTDTIFIPRHKGDVVYCTRSPSRSRV